MHNRRNFASRFPHHVAHYEVTVQLWQEASQDALEEHMDSLCLAYPELSSWLENKRVSWILAGLCRNVSQIYKDWWDEATHNTNLAESGNAQDNNTIGRHQSLLHVVIK